MTVRQVRSAAEGSAGGAQASEGQATVARCSGLWSGGQLPERLPVYDKSSGRLSVRTLYLDGEAVGQSQSDRTEGIADDRLAFAVARYGSAGEARLVGRYDDLRFSDYRKR
jgi:hypothetical protein